MPNDIEQAEHVLNNLRQKREALVVSGHRLGEERAKLSFSAHAEADKAAQKRLDTLHGELGRFESELKSVDEAIGEAMKRLAAAERAEARAADRQRAEEARKHVDELAEVFPYVDKHLTAALRGLLAIERGVAELHQKEVAFPTDNQLRLGMVTVLGTWLQQLPKMWFNEISGGVPFRAPAARKSAISYWTQIEPSLRNAIRQRLGEGEQTKTEHAA